MYKKLIFSFFILMLVLELSAKYILGLGTPALFIPHPTIEYMYKPNQSVKRFGNHITINQFGMRSNSLPAHKQQSELRIMVLGDSIINGGSKIDQASLATTLAEDELHLNLNRKITVGNVSAGSWGPGNLLAYVKAFGFFDADVAIIVLSSHDYYDAPTYKPLDPYFQPVETPLCALCEGLSRYLPRYLPFIGPSSHYSNTNKVTEKNISSSLALLKELLKITTTRVNSVVVLQHWDIDETATDKPSEGNYRIKHVAKDFQLTLIQLGPIYKNSMENNQDLFYDKLHLNSQGQKILSGVIVETVTEIYNIKRLNTR